jgi:hypothetical protein
MFVETGMKGATAGRIWLSRGESAAKLKPNLVQVAARAAKKPLIRLY